MENGKYADKRNSKELVKAAINCEEVDRVPFMPPFQGWWAMDYAGLTVSQGINDPKAAAKAQLDIVDRCGIDSIEVMWDWLYPVEALGCEVKIPEHGTIGTQSHFVHEESQLDGIEVPNLDEFYRHATLRDATKYIYDAVGKDHYLLGIIPGPFTIAGELRGVEDMLMDIMLEPEFAEALVNKSIDLTGEVARYVLTWDLDGLTLGDPTTSGDLLGLPDFIRFSQPGLIKVGKQIKDAGKDFIIHMCGDTNDRISEMADAGAQLLSVDVPVDIKAAIEKLNGRVAIDGNIDPAGTMYSGDVAAVRKSAQERLELGGNKGYLLGLGCEIPIGTPIENVIEVGKVSRGL